MIASKALRQAVVACLFWRIGLFAGEITRCGLLGPHGHELLAGAGPQALAEHLEAEAACQAGQTPPAEPERPDPAGAVNGRVLSTSDLRAPGPVLGGWDMPAALPLPLAVLAPAGIWSVQRVAGLGPASVELPPPSPPPCVSRCPEQQLFV